MLIAREFDLTNQLSNSDGEKLADLDTQTFVALYDSNIISDPAFEEYLDECIRTECFDTNDNIVILPINTYKNFSRMLKENYELVKK